MGDVYLVIAVAKDNVTMLAKLTEEEMGRTDRQRSATERLPDRMEKKVR